MEVNVTATGAPNVFNVTVAQSGSGSQGPKGDPGKSAYQVAIDNGFVGTEQEWLDSLQGEPGLAGHDGADGLQGPKGDPGEQGIPGSDGQDGAPGQDGESAYQIWLNEGNEGTEQDFLDSLVGPRGEQGIQGVPGQDGEDGAPGTDGEDGAPGTNGITPHIDDSTGNWFIGETDTGVHAEGPHGEQGEQGIQGIQGEKGDPGDQGIQGIQGIQGEPGEKGETGDEGPQGPKGDPGEDVAKFYGTLSDYEALPSDKLTNDVEHFIEADPQP